MKMAVVDQAELNLLHLIHDPVYEILQTDPSFEEAGWPSRKLLGFTIETAGRLPVSISQIQVGGCPGCELIALGGVRSRRRVAYWNGLQMLQYAVIRIGSR